MDDRFVIAGIRPAEKPPAPKKRMSLRGKPLSSLLFLGAVLLGCLCCELFLTKDPAYMDLAHCSVPPGGEFLFGTDAMGRDIFSMIWYGGRISLFVGFASALISAAAAILIGTVSGLAPRWLDGLLMRLTEIFLSVPGLLLILLVQAVLGKATVLSLSVVIGLTGWTSIAKVVRMEVRQLRTSEYVAAARCMGGGALHILRKHLLPNFFPSILFMVVMNVRNAVVTEATRSFLGIGLPLEIISWGSMLSLSEKALTAGAWWMILIPGVFLVGTLLCLTNLGNFLRRTVSRRERNL